LSPFSLFTLCALATTPGSGDPSVVTYSHEAVLGLTQLLFVGTIAENRWYEVMLPAGKAVMMYSTIEVEEQLHGEIESGRVFLTVPGLDYLPPEGTRVLVYARRTKSACGYSGCADFPRYETIPYYSDVVNLAIAGSLFFEDAEGPGRGFVSNYYLQPSWRASSLDEAIEMARASLPQAGPPITLPGLSQ
jgi:hypothetical protein